MNIQTFDLNLLRVLDALLSERSVTRAAQRLHLSQPAVSNALARLRIQTGDALLVRGNGGLLPTPRAQAMATPIRQILENIESTLTPVEFNPRTHVQTFNLMMPDYVELLLLPELIAEVSRSAPMVKLSVQSFAPTTASDCLINGTLDLAFGYLGSIAEQLYRQPLLTESFVCVVRADHPRIKDSLSLEQFLTENHALVSPQGGGFSGLVDDLLAQQGLKRNVVLSIPHFTIVPSIIINTDLIITMTKSTAQKYLHQYAIKILPSPFNIPEYAVSQAWHSRTQNEPSHRWLREIIQHIANTITGKESVK